MNGRLLLVDRSENGLFRSLEKRLDGNPPWNLELTWARTLDEALDAADSERAPGGIVFRHAPPEFDAFVFLSQLDSRSTPPPVLVVHPQGSDELALETMRAGATDAILDSDLEGPRLFRSLFHLLEKGALVRKLENQRSELEAFTHTAAHDLKAPLRRIASFCELIERDCRGKLDERTDRYLDYVLENTHRMAQLIDQLLEYSRIGRSETPFEPVALEEVLDRCRFDLEEMIEDAGATVKSGTLPTVWGDGLGLQLVLQNLLTNGIKFRGERSPEIEIRAEEEGAFWRIVVADNGIGIDPAYFEKIFQPFKRIPTQPEVPGTGIGLATVKKIVQRHNGTLGVHSDPGKGSEFFFTLPGVAGGVEAL